MPTDVQPIEGNWYFNRSDGQRFSVVGLDDAEDSIEIQLEDGNRDEIARDRWPELDIEPAEPVINAHGPFDDTGEGDIDYMANDPHAAHVPSEQERYRRENVEFAGKTRPGFPDPRPEHDENRGPERGSERGVEQWPETREGE